MINKLFLSLYSLIFCLCISAEAVSQVNIQAQRLNSIGSGYRERSFRVENDQSGSTYVIGLTRGTPDYDFNGGGFIPENYNTPGYFLIKYNQLHQPLWGYQTKYPESLLGILNSKISRNGNLIIAGYYSGLFIDIDFSSASVSHLVNQPYGNYGLYVAVYDSAGHFLYHNEIIAQHDSLNVMLGDRTFISDIETDDDDNIYVTGYSGDVMLPAGNQNDTLKEFTYFMAKYDSACNLIWLHHLNKEIKEFHNWTNFNNLMLDADHAGNLYATITFTDSLNICFENEGPQYVFAKPYDYQWNPFSAESHNRDFIIIKYDNNGHYLKHVQFGSAINSTQKHLDAIFANDKLTVLAAFDSEINFSDTAFHSSGQDTVYDYNLALMQFDTALQCVTKHRFYNNILSPRQGNNYLAADECGNVLLRCNLSEYNAFPFPPFATNDYKIIDRDNLYLFDRNLKLRDSIVTDFHTMSDFSAASISNGTISLISTFLKLHTLGNFSVSEVPSISGQDEYDVYLAQLTYEGCHKEPAQGYVLEFPNVFTPNNDNWNEVFEPILISNVNDLSIDIYDRWGIKLFRSSSASDWWKGFNKSGMPVPAGVYFYVASFNSSGKAYKKSGSLTLIR